MKRKRIKLFRLHPIRRSSRKIGRNEPCPCGRTKEAVVADAGELFLDGHGTVKKTVGPQVRVKYKHCHGNAEFQKKQRLVKNKLSQYFYDLTHVKPKKPTLAVLAGKLKEIFSIKHFGRKY